MTRILVLGAGGMLGHTLFRHLAINTTYEVHGTVRGVATMPDSHTATLHGVGTLHGHVDVLDRGTLLATLDAIRPDVILNCVGLIKQRESSLNVEEAIAINALLPHQLAGWCNAHGSRLIHFSTDCVFAGDRGDYREADHADADDLYGRSKYLGEVNYGRHLTIRTSLIGHELTNHLSLVDWFLGAKAPVSGYAQVVFSGLPTIEIAHIIQNYILPHDDLCGLYHLSAAPIDKDRLLRLIASAYGRRTQVLRSEHPRLDRSLNSEPLRHELNYSPPSWEKLIADMHSDYIRHYSAVREEAVS
jgi:dTDP-4-dehydrorhamnose reductase